MDCIVFSFSEEGRKREGCFDELVEDVISLAEAFDWLMVESLIARLFALVDCTITCVD